MVLSLLQVDEVRLNSGCIQLKPGIDKSERACYIESIEWNPAGQAGYQRGEVMAKDIKRMTRIELESELVAERAATRRSNTIILMMAVLAALGFMLMAGTVAPITG